MKALHGCPLWVLEHLPSHRPFLHTEDVPTSAKGWSCAVLAQKTAEAQRCKEVLWDHPLHFSQGRKDLVCVNGHASMCGVCKGVSMYVFTYVLWKETKISPRHGRNCSARKGIKKNPLFWREAGSHTHRPVAGKRS